MIRTIIISIIVCFLSIKSQAQSQNFDQLRNDGKYIIWPQVDVGIDQVFAYPFFEAHAGFGLHAELFNGIATAQYKLHFYPFATLTSKTQFEEYSLLYGRYKKTSVGIIVLSAGASYLNGSKVIEPNEFRNSSTVIHTIGLATQLTYYLTFGAGPAIGLGTEINLNPVVPSVSLNLCFGFGILKWNN